MASTKKENKNKTTTNEYDDNTSSISTLEFELSEYLVRNESSAYHELYPGVEMLNYDYTVERQNNYSTKYINFEQKLANALLCERYDAKILKGHGILWVRKQYHEQLQNVKKQFPQPWLVLSFSEVYYFSLIESTAHLIKGCLGAGVLGMHEAFMNGGLWTSLAVTIVIGFTVSYSMLMLVGSAQSMYGRLRVSRLSYPDLAEVALAAGPFKFCRKLSKTFRYIVDIFIYFDFIGTCCIFEIMIAQTLEKVLKSLTSWEFTTSQYILIITFPLMTLCLIRSLKYLAPFSIIADLVTGVCVIITMYYSITIASSLSDRRSWNNVHGFFRMLGICIYSINGIGVALPIENNMKKPQYFRIVVQCAMPIVISYVAIIGFFGYWAWGDYCQSPFTAHMPTNTLSQVMQGFLAITFGVTFAVHFWVAFRIIWRYLGKRYKRKRGIWERIFRSIHVFVISCLCLVLPNMVTWMSFVGNFFTAFLLLIFPALIDILVKWREPRRHKFRWSLAKNISLIFVGIILCGGAFYSA